MQKSKTKRNREILNMRKQGYSLKAIADKYRISKDRVSEICRKYEREVEINGNG